MSEILATSPRLDHEAPTVEGRLADIIETSEVRLDEYRLSDSDRAKVVAALRAAAPAPATDETAPQYRMESDLDAEGFRTNTRLVRGEVDRNRIDELVTELRKLQDIIDSQADRILNLESDTKTAPPTDGRGEPVAWLKAKAEIDAGWPDPPAGDQAVVEEREACAKVCDYFDTGAGFSEVNFIQSKTARSIASAIRARGGNQ